ncbi:23S rRNA (cytidine1920-2'-O)/16S rRNA (cytidine1409-2'-O)-methyltransferase [Amphibacillus marinus]|uniref:23S rRNA (Cytidine1920-2'-O)/16S rRNA (Cytidine1409-2'-O)-methyltransferase n=1 Tax=Amphibacillus marinus TaxID=872970 RepID=A0A1H8NKK3_9BACI|nr:TlyA family RNA methyltransferase [Amphibacillus marinus]SEO30144.1 23S rRNA (cytidine1920-2'-O)/16S rRNA (cytidine1409-2'-O)-methyltransferase [Amphibacillus marinus]
MKVNKLRLDILLVERGLIETREQAKRAIMAGTVYSETERLDKPGLKVNEDIPLLVKGNKMPYVGRGGLKLEKALSFFDISMHERIMLDIGSSTGGFTDCALQNGASLCYAVDVGYNQLAWKLRNDQRVEVMERTNFRYATAAMFTKGTPNIATIDVSFISLKLILPPLRDILENGSDVIALIKPQFEAGKDQVGKKGIVKDPVIHQQVLIAIVKFAEQQRFTLNQLTFSPITGGDGNIEFLAHFTLNKVWKGESEPCITQINKVVKDAHQQLVDAKKGR